LKEIGIRVDVSEETHRKFKIKLAENGKTIKEILTEAIDKYIAVEKKVEPEIDIEGII
jgi:hypothetical protein